MSHNIIIYESSSFGGNYQYALQLHKAYAENAEVDSCQIVLPKNSPYNGQDIHNILCNDSPKKLKKINFLIRHFFNPLIFFFFLLKQKSSFVLLNDFEQNSAFLWVSLYKLFLKKHCFAIFLHDPDRDNYPPSKAFSSFSMKNIISLCEFGLYHEHLPEKPYYQNKKVNFLSVPHGIYPLKASNLALLNNLKEESKNHVLVSILGNIRAEKNYEIAIKSLQHIPKMKLLIAGKPSSSDFDIEELKTLAKSLNVYHQIIWKIEYLTEKDLSACIEASDIILLYYAKTFTSQSGIINLIAPFKKRVIISDVQSSLKHITQKFNLGTIVDADNQEVFTSSLLQEVNKHSESGYQGSAWDKYISYASWENQVSIVLKKLLNNYNINHF